MESAYNVESIAKQLLLNFMFYLLMKVRFVNGVILSVGVCLVKTKECRANLRYKLRELPLYL